MEEFFVGRSSWGVVMRSSWGFTTLHEVAVVLIAAAVLTLLAFAAFSVARGEIRRPPGRGWGERGLTLLEAIIVLLIVAVVVLAIFVLA